MRQHQIVKYIRSSIRFKVFFLIFFFSIYILLSFYFFYRYTENFDESFTKQHKTIFHNVIKHYFNLQSKDIRSFINDSTDNSNLLGTSLPLDFQKKFTSYHLDNLLIINNKRKVLHELKKDSKSLSFSNLLPYDIMPKNQSLFSHFFLTIHSEIYELYSFPLVSSHNESLGYIVALRQISQSHFKDIEEMLNTSVTFSFENNSSLFFSYPLNDYQGIPIGYIHITTPHTHQLFYNDTMLHQLFLLILLGIILILTSLYFVKKYFSTPVAIITKSLESQTLQPLENMHLIDTEWNEIAQLVRHSFEQQHKIQELLKLRIQHVLLQHLGEGVYGVDKEGICVFINQSALAMLGYEENEVVGKRMHDLIHHHTKQGHEYPYHRCHVYRHLKEHSTFKGEEWIYNKIGQGFPVTLTAVAIHDDTTLIGTVVTFQDLSVQKQMEKEKNELLGLLSIILETVNAGIIVVDAQTHTIDLVNQEAEILFGTTKEKIIGCECHCFLCPHDKGQCPLTDLNHSIVHEKRLLVRYDKTTLPILKSAKYIELGGRKKIVELFVDISEQKKIEDKLKLINETLEQRIQEELEKNREKDQLMFQQARYAQMGEMISMIAHQWRQPLNAVNASIIDIRVKEALEGINSCDMEESFSFIEKQIAKMSQTINDFMNFFKPSKAKETFSIHDLCTDIRIIVEAQLKNHGISLIIEENAIELYGYKNELEHVLLNIITNARDAFETQNTSQTKTIALSIQKNNSDIIFIINDNAGGIPEGIIERIFEPYFTTKEQGKGTGIGLYMTKNIIEKSFKGSIHAHNNETGACFTIKIPHQESQNHS